MAELSTDYMWRHTWPSAEVLCEFIATNPNLWKDKIMLEIGAGVAALPSLTALRCGAAKIIITEQAHLEQAFELIRRNLRRNFDASEIDESVRVMPFDWKDLEESIKNLRNETAELDYVFGSDVFYDPCVFELLMNVIRQLFKHYPNVEFYFAYQIRDSDWTIEQLLISSGLRCTLIRCVDTKQHSICLGKITKITHNNKMPIRGEEAHNAEEGRMYFAGIDGGATHSTLVLIDSTGNKIGEWSDGPGLNFLLNGLERTADQIAKWVREAVMEKAPTKLPIASLGMGLSGAEDDQTNTRMLEYLRRRHGDLTENFFLTTDSVAALATTFENGGVVLIAGTGSSCRLLKANGQVHGVGGWGHLIGDGGGGFWITMRAVRTIFDYEDGLLGDISMERIALVKSALLRHFGVDTKLALLDILYNPQFSKRYIASFCKKLSELASDGDEFAAQLFVDAGELLAEHISALSRHFDEEMFTELPILLVGSVFKSWALIRKGFEAMLRKKNEEQLTGGTTGERRQQIRAVTLYNLDCSPAIGSAILGSKMVKTSQTSLLMKLQSRKYLDKICF